MGLGTPEVLWSALAKTGGAGNFSGWLKGDLPRLLPCSLAFRSGGARNFLKPEDRQTKSSLCPTTSPINWVRLRLDVKKSLDPQTADLRISRRLAQE